MEVNLLLLGIYLISSVLIAITVPQAWRWKGILVIGLACCYLIVGNRITLFLIVALGFYSCGILISQKKLSTWIAIPIALFPLLISKLLESKGHFSIYRSATASAPFEGDFLFFFQIVGISYFTFTGIGYLIDVKRGYIEAETSFAKLLLFLIYFPALTSGPIHRAKYLIPQFDKIGVSDESISKGCRLILLGLFKNLVVGQRLYNLLTLFYYNDVTGPYTLLIGLLFFLFLYVNFSSYIDIFQGISEVVGIRLKSNFKNRIYFAGSRQNFWSGWHITLNEWFRDYFTFPLAHKYRYRAPIDIILIATFILVALWHELTFVMLIWGVLNGLWIILEKKVPFHVWP
ncbi:MAG: hypothetical protein K2U26_10225, partial [Cyclobacteriaceae bacterium]|nr:hypothetical protein [Cyclobacteriaceae bacterium]